MFQGNVSHKIILAGNTIVLIFKMQAIVIT